LEKCRNFSKILEKWEKVYIEEKSVRKKSLKDTANDSTVKIPLPLYATYH